MIKTPAISHDVSVVIPSLIRTPSFQAITRLNRAIMSILEQDFPGRFEIVLVDDHSPEPIQFLLKNTGFHYDADLRIIRMPRSNGLVQALNTGIMAAKYDLIARLDDDDIWLPGKIAKQLHRFAHDPDLSIIATSMRLVFEDGRPPEDHIRPDGWSRILHFFCDVGCPFAHGSILARKDVFRVLGGYPQTAEVSHCEDYALWANWVRFFKPGMIEEIFYDYTVSPTSVSSVNAQRNQRISDKIKSEFKLLEVNDLTPTAIYEIAGILGVSILQAGVICFRLWHYNATATLPEAMLTPLRSLLPDRNVRPLATPGNRRVLTAVDLLKGLGEQGITPAINAARMVTVSVGS